MQRLALTSDLTNTLRSGGFSVLPGVLLLVASCSSEPTTAQPAPPAAGGNAPTAGSGGGVLAGTGGSEVPAGGSGAGTNPGTGGAPTAGTGGNPGAGVGGSDPGVGGGPAEPPPLGTWPPPALELTQIASIPEPTAIAQPPGDPSRLFVAEIAGRIRVIRDGQLVPTPALDINEKVLVGDPLDGQPEREPGQGKRGLVGLAFHPNYAENGRVFVMYAADQDGQGYAANRDDGDQTLEEYRRSADNPDVFDPEPVSTFLQFDKGSCQLCYQHNGGSLEIGIDGFLYASTGDPPPYEDTLGSTDLNSPMGKILRFDISGDTVVPAGNYPGGDPVVWHIGIRNAYKFSFDSVTGTLYVADVGETQWEEISVVPYGQNHVNFGWPVREGMHDFNGGPCEGCIEPIAEYGHIGGDEAVIGGYVYRGTAIPALQGTYLYGDNNTGRFRALQWDKGMLVNGPVDLEGINARMGCFGQDLAGEVYVCGFSEDAVYRIDAAD